MAGDEMRRKPNTLYVWGNAATMNLNSLILTNITNSPYFKGSLAELKTYHEIVDEIYYKVRHLEPWEKGSRRTAGQTGMCGGVRGVGAGGIISTAFCLLYKLFTMKLTRKQVIGLMNHADSPYIRGLGFMYVRFTQPPADLWEWFEPYIDDSEEVDVRAGGGQVITIGEMVRLFMTKLDWFSSLFPRIPVPIQIGIDKKLAALKLATSIEATPRKTETMEEIPRTQPVQLRSELPAEPRNEPTSSSRLKASSTAVRKRSRSPSSSRAKPRNKDNSRERSSRDKDKDGRGSRKRSRSKSRSPSRSHGHHTSKSRHRDRDHGYRR